MPSLPISSVEEIFARMSVTYGSAWSSMWIGIDPERVKSEWAEGLGYYAARPDAIHHALDHLPVDRPPNVLQFRVICRGAPEPAKAPQLPGMPAVKADIGRLKAAFHRFKELRAELKKRPLQWAYDLQERERQGDSLTEGQRLAWREALRVTPVVDCVGGAFGIIDEHKLPPGMRSDFAGWP